MQKESYMFTDKLKIMRCGALSLKKWVSLLLQLKHINTNCLHFQVEATQKGHLMINPSHYLFDHPKHTTHFQIAWTKFHNFLPNIIGPWFPCHDGKDVLKAFYYASMLTLLKPWRNLQHLKGEYAYLCIFSGLKSYPAFGHVWSLWCHPTLLLAYQVITHSCDLYHVITCILYSTCSLFILPSVVTLIP